MIKIKMLRYFFAFSCFFMSTPALAQVMVIGPSEAQSCYESTLLGDRGTKDARDICQAALKTPLNKKDRAATHVNLGVLLMRGENYPESEIHYKAAIELAPNLSETYINYGAALIYMNKDEESLEALNQAISLKTKKMPEALFNRAILYDRQNNHTAAYKDLKRALDLRPNWQPALNAISRYDVKTRS